MTARATTTGRLFSFFGCKACVIQNLIMRRLHLLSVIALLTWLPLLTGRAGEYKLANGNVLRGEVASTDEDGLVVKLDVGGFSRREAWINLSQETLKELAKDPKVAPLVEPFIELEPEEIKAKEKQKEIVVKEVPNRMERPAGKISLASAMMTPIGLGLLLVLFLTNLYAAYEIAGFRHHPVALVCGLSVIAPIVGPIIFLSLPAATPGHAEAGAPAPEAAPPIGGAKATTSHVPPAAASGLSLASSTKAGGGGQAVPQTFTRGETTFNRRFFETKFAGFFRVVPGEAEKDLVLDIKVVRGEYVAKRITRISSNEMHVQVLNGGEVMIQFAEITTVIVRHKDAKS